MISFWRKHPLFVLLCLFATVLIQSDSFLLGQGPRTAVKENQQSPLPLLPSRFQENQEILKNKIVLYSSNNNIDENDVLGVGSRGITLFCIVALFNVWLFSIPTEFRRAKYCSEEQVRLYPDSNCMTKDMWIGGIQEYYTNGGGIKFDFSSEGK